MKIFFRPTSLLVCVSLVIVGVMAVFTVHAAQAFPDIEGHQYRESIEFLSSRGVVQGYPNGTFGPDRAINRAEIMKIIIEASTSGDIGNGTNCFPDVHSEWFAKYICYAKDHNIVQGYPDGTFKPGQYVTIAESLKMGLESFSEAIDHVGGDAWYQAYLEFVHNNNIFSKYSLRPDVSMTRGAMAYLIQQLMLEKEGLITFTGKRSVASPGCGQNAPSTIPTSSVVNGELRHYITVIGDKYDKDMPMKMIFAFHGRTNPNTMVRSYYKVEQASKGDAIIVYPSGLPEEGPSRNWSNPGDSKSKLRDFALFDQLLQEFSNNYCINKDEVFVVGHSLGAWFTNSLSCARGNVIRAIGSVAGGTTINDCSGPTAAIIMHNPDDNLTPFREGETARDQLLKQNACGPETIPLNIADGNCVAYTQCQKDAPVIWCPYSDSYEHNTYYPHTWPNFAGQAIWDFFATQK